MILLSPKLFRALGRAGWVPAPEHYGRIGLRDFRGIAVRDANWDAFAVSRATGWHLLESDFAGCRRIHGIEPAKKPRTKRVFLNEAIWDRLRDLDLIADRSSQALLSPQEPGRIVDRADLPPLRALASAFHDEKICAFERSTIPKVHRLKLMWAARV